MPKLNKDNYEKAARIILNPVYGYNETSKSIARAYLNPETDKNDETWNELFINVLRMDYILSTPMRLIVSILEESEFHHFHDRFNDCWIDW